MQRIGIEQGARNPSRASDTRDEGEIIHLHPQLVNCPQNGLSDSADPASRASCGALDVAAGIIF
jgi:hypothetical protein